MLSLSKYRLKNQSKNDLTMSTDLLKTAFLAQEFSLRNLNNLKRRRVLTRFRIYRLHCVNYRINGNQYHEKQPSK